MCISILIISFPRYQMDYLKKQQMGLLKGEDETESKLVKIYDKAPGQEPTTVKAEDLIVKTSSKKEKS